jgi:hypothetical protein
MKKIAFGIAAAGLLTLAGNTFAEPYGENTLEQRASQRSDDKINDALEKLNATCGTKITAAINWKAYGSFTEAERAGRTTHNIYEIAGDQTAGSLYSIMEGCKDDTIFKANVVKKIKNITFTVTKEKEVSAKVPSHTFKIANGVLAITYNFQSSNDTAGTVRNYI